eukprot:TRINITY_DN8984_c0_g1_i1.p1 TRINITY_DN8984_c0_g1~~TRINITY_DN8984_c0_g1_i1.p1  ORF type:complete len:404 (-),score=106.48 TRINITY_DN8984_c0_g1_i1:35-1246(-)
MTDKVAPSYYYVSLSDFRGYNLTAKDSNGYSDPYFKFNFDNFEKFKSNYKSKSLNPQWKESKSFVYRTKFAIDRMKQKKLHIEVYDNDKLNADDFIGQCFTSLHTLATGPVQQDLQLYDKKENPAGRLSFKCEMSCVAKTDITLRQVKVLGLEHNTTDCHRDGTFDAYLDIKFQRDMPEYVNTIKGGKDAREEVKTAKNRAATPEFVEIRPLWTMTSLRHLLGAKIAVKVYHARMGKDPLLGSFELPVHSVITFDPKHWMDFQVPLEINGAQVGTVEGQISFNGVPRVAPMINGVRKDGDILDPEMLMSGLPLPDEVTMAPETIKSAPISIHDQPYSTNTMAYDSVNFEPQYVSRLPEEIHPGSPETAEDKPLPSFWEEKVAPDGRHYYVDHRNQRTQWNRPT